ncbi:MAG: GtrA family protein [Herbinix sp.]|nr:GtrA family protein [Herbinix sp.]
MITTLKKIFDKTFGKFVVVGIINTLVGSAIMFILYNFAGCNYWISTSANYILGSILSYVLNKHFTFQNNDKSLKVIVRFVINIILCYLLAYSVAKPLVLFLLPNVIYKERENIAMIVGMGIYVILNYIGQRFWTFKNRNKYL